MSPHPLSLDKSAPVQLNAIARSTRLVHRALATVAPLNALDFALLGTMTLILFPVFRLAHLPLRINFVGISVAFWFGTAVMGTFAAVLLSLIALPWDRTIAPFVQRLKEKKGLIVIALVLATVMVSLLGVWLGFVVTVDALTAGELLERTKGSLKSKLLDVLVPAAYLFYGLILLLAFNHAVPGIRNPGAFDNLLNHADWVLFHVNVPALVHHCVDRFPLWLFRAFEIVYYGMFVHLTGALVFLAIAGGRIEAVRMVRALVVCNTIGLIVYTSMPAIGPWAVCQLHQTRYPQSLATYATQEAILHNAHMLWEHISTPETSRVDVTDAFISFPSLHIAGPLIAFWFLRGFRWMARAYFAIYLICLAPAIVLLEWHYVVDLVAGAGLAFSAIWVSRFLEIRHSGEMNAATRVGQA